MRQRLKTAALFIAIFLAMLPSKTHATTNRFSAYDLWPSVGERNFFTVSSSETLYRFQFEAGVSNAYVFHPLDVVDATGTRVRSAIDYYFAHTITAGIGLADFAQLGLAVPVFSTARFQDPTVTPAPGTSGVFKVGDIRVAGKVRILDSNKHRFGVAAEPFATIPLGAKSAYLGDAGVAGGLKLIGDFLVTDRIRLALNLGAEFRSDDVAVSNIAFNHRFLSGLGISGHFTPHLTASAEVQANTSLNRFFSDRDTTPVEFIGGVQWEVGQTGLTVGVGGGSCAICGAKGAQARGFVNLGYRRQNETYTLKDAEASATRVASSGSGERLSDQILYLREHCPGDPSEFDPKLHDAACPKYFELKDQAITMGRLEDEQFATVILDLKKNCPADPSEFNPEVHDAGCPKFFALRDEIIELRASSSLSGTNSEKFATVMLDLKKNCPANAAEFDPEIHDAGCPKYYKIREDVVKVAKQDERKHYAILKKLRGQDEDGDGIPDAFDSCPSNPEDKNSIADDDGCPEYGVTISENDIRTVAPVRFDFNKVTLDKEASEILRHVTEAFFVLPHLKEVEVVGYADIVGTPAANYRISLMRAKKVIEYLTLRGIPEGLVLTPVGRGAEDPVAPNTTAEGRLENRRVIFRLVGGGGPKKEIEIPPKAKRLKKPAKKAPESAPATPESSESQPN